MCGNGVRCLAKLAFDHGHVSSAAMTVESDAGVNDVALLFDGNGRVVGARVGMGEVRVSPSLAQADIAGRRWTYRAVDAGNAHAVIFVAEDPRESPVEEVGSAFQELPQFADGVNVEFAQVRADGSIAQRTFERGSGETLACGTGATAVGCAALDQGLVVGPQVTVQLLGGELRISRAGSAAIMEGPARTVFIGQIDLPID
jgi:diaminopimelate epimerase